MSLYLKHRPTNLDEVVGQEHAVQVLKTKLKDKTLPHVVMFTGPTGTGKTTLARIVARELGCTEGNLIEANSADTRGIDDVRAIREAMSLSPMGGKCRVWILDECVQLLKATQQAFLKILEDTPPKTYFLLCTSDTTGLLPTFVGRCFIVGLKELSGGMIRQIIANVLVAEKQNIDESFLKGIVSMAQGNARKALNLLETGLAGGDIKSSSIDQEEKSEFLARLLFQGASWKEVVTSINSIEFKDLETIRRQVLGYANKMLQNSNNKQLAYKVIQAFREPWHSCGEAGLTTSCYEVLNPGR
jgi:DNA polymerase III subunit gamma/tau